MAASNNVFTDNETNNWFKACLALNITKEGLANFLVSELQKVHTTVGSSCGNCCIETLIPCPTQPYCSKRKKSYCPFHKSQKPQQCFTCDKVKKNITSNHRYNYPSWRNTDAKKWASDYWEIGKCFLPPDGYSSVLSVQESDFNGVISILLNCTHFQNCLSPSCLSPPPPNKQSPLEMVRQIGRDVRHTSDCKVTDADLQGYFQRLSTLLADPKCLLHDHSATIALTRLNDLQNNKMSLKELGELLKEAYQTLDRAKETGERVSKEAEITQEEALKKLETYIQAGEQRIESKIQLVEQRIETKGKDEIARIQQAANKTEDYKRGVADLRQRLMEYYNDTTCNVPLSNLDESLDKRITDMYATPKIQRIKIEKDGKRVKTDKHVLTYKDLFFTNNKSNQRIYIQGEPGRGKSTFAVKLVHDWCNENQPSRVSSINDPAFEDRLTIQKFKFLFLITLRDSSEQTDVTQMIKKQLVDKMFSEDERADEYKLFVQIMKTEICLVVREGLDEWVCPSDSNLAEPSMAGFPKDTCTVLTTTRPWKLADEKIKNSQIDSLLEIEGISSPYLFAKNILRCITDQTEALEDTVDKFELFIKRRELKSLSSSPMLYALVICTWVDTIGEEEHLKGSSLCLLYTTMLESLCKKANNATGFFNDSNAPPVHCFSRTYYLQPNMELLNKLAGAACKLLFSFERETAIVFNDITLSNYFSNEEFTDCKMFALKAGILTNKKEKSRTDNSNSFIHKTVQEFLAAYHIACNPDVIDDIISRYLKCYSNSYLDIWEVLIFLCGMNISAANKLSALMNDCDVDHCSDASFPCAFQRVIESGIREAVANKQDDIRLKLSHFYITPSNLRDLNLIWSTNTSNVNLLEFFGIKRNSLSRDEQTSHFEVNLSSCHKLKRLKLLGNGILLRVPRPGFEPGTSGMVDQSVTTRPPHHPNNNKYTASSDTPKHPASIVLNNADQVQCADPSPVLPSLERIDLYDVACSSTWLHSLFSTMLTCDHKVVFKLKCGISSRGISSCAESVLYTMQTRKRKFKMHMDTYNSPGLWEAFHGLNIESLTLSGWKERLIVNHVKSLSQTLSSLKQLESLSIEMYNSLCKAFHGLNIKSLTLNWDHEYDPNWYNERDILQVNHVKSLPQTLSSLKQLEKLSIKDYGNPGVWEALTGLNIKSLTMNGCMDGLSLSQTLSSLKQMETLRIYIWTSPLWEALNGLNIKSLTLYKWIRLDRNHVESLSQTLSSLKQLETLSIDMYNSRYLCEALNGLNIKNIKSLTLSCWDESSQVINVESLSQTLSSLKQLETLSIDMFISPSLLKVLNGLNIKSLTLSGLSEGLQNHVESLSPTLLSLKQLETLTICVNNYIDIQLPQSLKYVNIYCYALCPTDLSKLIDTLSACDQKIEGKLEFGCVCNISGVASICDFEQIPVLKYMAILQELKKLNTVAVKRFQIFDRITSNMRTGDTDSVWSLRGICDADDDHEDFGNAQYRLFILNIGNNHVRIINRISMRFVISPASIS